MGTNNKSYYRSLLVVFLLYISLSAYAQKRENYEKHFQLRSGYVIGATSPLSMPAEIRELRSYKPGFHYSIGYEITNQFNTIWGVITGVRLETHGMEIKTVVKSYNMDMIKDRNRMVGYFSGTVETDVNCTFLTIPILVTYTIKPNIKIVIGPYCQLALNKHFSGIVYDGYIRIDDGRMNNGPSTGPTGQKVDISYNNPATYDFSNDMNSFQFGLEIGAERTFNSTYGVFVSMNYGLNDALQKDFDVMQYKLYHINATIGFNFHF